MAKFKVSDLAKDFGVKNNTIIDLLKNFNESPKKANSNIEDDELDFVFEHFTKTHEVASFDDYFSAKKPEAKKEEKPVKENKPAKENKGEKSERQERKPENKKENASEKKNDNKAPFNKN